MQSDITAIPSMQLSCQTGSIASLALRDYRVAKRTDATELLPALKRFREAVVAFPHHGMLKAGNHWCVGCALYGEALYINAGLALLEAKILPTAEAMLRIARAIAPASPHAAANLGHCLMMRSEGLGGEAAAALLRESVTLFDRAIELRPEYRGYDHARARAAGSVRPN